MGTSVRKMYDAELLQLDTMLARMGHAAGGAIESAMTALRSGDTELARSVIARDSEIDSAEHEIEHRCLTLFLRQQPVAGDLRKVSTALKMVTDIERIADQASDIAEITLHLHPDGARLRAGGPVHRRAGHCPRRRLRRDVQPHFQGNCGLHRRPPRRCRDGAGLIYD